MRSALVPILLADPMPWAFKAPYAWDFLRDRARFAGGYKGALSNTPNWTSSPATHSGGLSTYASKLDGSLQAFASGAFRRTDRGALTEGAGTNLCLQSQTFDNATWGKVSCSVSADAAAAPDGTTTADKVTPAASSSVHNLAQTVTGTATSHTASIYLKPAGYSKFGFRENTTLGSYATFNLSGSGSVIATGTASATITALADGWYRVTITYTAAATPQLFGWYVLDDAYASGSPHAYAYTADGTSGIYYWGAQLEAKAYASSYVPTTTGSATRAADSLTVTGVTGLAYPLTIYCECELSSDAAGNQPAIWIDNGSGNTDLANLAAQMSTKKLRSTITASSAAQADISSTASSLAVGSVFKGALRVATNDAQQGLNGALATADTSVTLPSSPTILRFGINNTPGYLYGYLRRLAIFSRALSDGELQALTAA